MTKQNPPVGHDDDPAAIAGDSQRGPDEWSGEWVICLSWENHLHLLTWFEEVNRAGPQLVANLHARDDIRN
jgi:hypothetical protein